MKFQKTLLASSVAIATLALVACGGDDSSQDSGTSSSTSFTGLVIDGRIANGFVWIDMNEDGKWESGEPKAYTDADGYYSYNYEKNVNYCSGTTANERYCLNSNALTGYSLVRLTGGTEVSTGQKFRGMLTSTVYSAYNGSLSTSGVFDTRGDYYGWIYPILRPPVPTPPIQEPYSVMTPSTTMLWSAAQRIGATTDPVTNPAQTVHNALVGTGTLDQNSLLTSQLVPPVDSTSTSWSVTQERAKLQLAGQTTMNLAANIVTRATTSTNAPTLDTVLGSLSSRISSATTPTPVVNLQPSDLQTVFSRVGVSSASSEATTLQSGLQASNNLINQISTTTTAKSIAETLRAAQTAQAAIDRALALALDPNATDTQKTSSGNVISNVNSNAATLVTQIKTQQADTTKSVVVVDTLVKKLETAGADIETAVSDAAVEEADPSIWVTHYLSMSGQDTTDNKVGRAILFFKGKAGDQSGEVAVCYAFSDPSQSKTEDRKRVGHLTAGWTAIPGLGVVDITSQYGDFQIQATGKVSPSSDTDNGKYFLGFGDAPTNTFGRFTFKSDEFDQDAVWYSDHRSETDENSANYSYEQWGLRALPTGQTVPTKKSECDDVLLADSKTLLGNLPSTVFTASDFNN